MSRQRGVKSLFVVATVVGMMVGSLSACSKAANEGNTGAVPLKIGVLAPLTGPQTALGEDIAAGLKYFVHETPKIAGRPIELIIEDSASQPQQGLTKARKLVNNDHVALVMGIVNSAVLQSVGDFVLGAGVPLIVTNAGSENFTSPKAKPLGFRVSHANGQNNRALGWYAYKKLGYRKVAVLTYDFIAGAEQADGFKSVFTSLGGKVVQEQKAPLGTPDFGPYISNIPANVDALYVFLSGGDSVKFFQQAKSFGLPGRVPIIGPGFTLDEIVLQAIGDAGNGFVGGIQYLSGVDTAENKKFVGGYKALVGRTPTVYAADAYTGLQAVAAAVEATGGSTDAGKFASALEAVRFKAPRGQFRFDDHHQAVFTVYFYRVVDGKVRILDHLDDVTQTWSPSSGS